MSNEVLKISNLVKKYDNSDRVILNNLDLTINDEDFLCILGPSGCGKSTLIRCIAGFEDYEGSIKVDGQPVVKPGPDRIMVFQDFNQLFPWKTVLKNITYALKVNGMKDKAEREQKAKKYLEKVNLVQYANYYPHQLSGGMKQRVVIAMALACNPSLLLADEPTSALDVTIQAQVLEMIKSLQDEFQTAMLLITHDLGVVAEVCSTVGIMYAGEIVEYSAVEEFFENTVHPYSQGLIAAIPRLDENVKRLNVIPGMMPDPMDLPSGCKFHTRCPYATELCKTCVPSMREVSPGHAVKCHMIDSIPKFSRG